VGRGASTGGAAGAVGGRFTGQAAFCFSVVDLQPLAFKSTTRRAPAAAVPG